MIFYTLMSREMIKDTSSINWSDKSIFGSLINFLEDNFLSMHDDLGYHTQRKKM